MKHLSGSADTSSNHPDLKGFDVATLNYNYIYRGANALKPRVAFDNGVKTFLEFSGDVPSIFLVGANGAESTVNSHREGRFIVIDKVAAHAPARFPPASTMAAWQQKSRMRSRHSMARKRPTPPLFLSASIGCSDDGD